MSATRKEEFDAHLVEAILEYEAAWADSKPPDTRAFAARDGDLAALLLREIALREFAWLWKAGREDIVEVHLNRYPEYRQDDEFVLALLRVELSFLPGEPDAAKLVARFPHLKDDIALLLDAYDEADRHQTSPPGALSHSPGTTVKPLTLVDSGSAGGSGQLTPGALLSVEDRYRILRLISEGGQKYVYEAHQLNPGRVVALKTPLHVGGAREMLLEGQVVAQLDHQKIPPIMNLGDGSGARPILAEKYIAGRSWKELLHEQRKRIAAADAKDQPALRREVLREDLGYLRDVCDALAYAHAELHVIHRDLKPANVMLSRFNQTLSRFTEVYVVDWGSGGLRRRGAGRRSACPASHHRPRLQRYALLRRSGNVGRRRRAAQHGHRCLSAGSPAL